MKWTISGRVETGYPYRCGSDGLQGHIHIGGKDFLKEFDDQDFGEKIAVSINSGEVYRGKYATDFGSGYSSWTPIDEDKFEVDGKSVLEHLAKMENQEVVVTIEDIN